MSDLWGIYDNYIKPFEKTDDAYRKRLNAIYKDRTRGKDKWNNFWDSFGSISASFIKSFVVAFAAAFVVAFAFTLSPWLVVGVLAVLAVGCVVMANVPEESVPSWLSGAKKAETASLKNSGKHISEADRAKLDSWKYSPDDELYLKYKDVYDNPKYYNQKTGEINWPGQNGDPDFVKIIKGKLRPNEEFIDGLVRMGYLDR